MEARDENQRVVDEQSCRPSRELRWAGPRMFCHGPEPRWDNQQRAGCERLVKVCYRTTLTTISTIRLVDPAFEVAWTTNSWLPTEMGVKPT
jgi:hypothetical protein